MLQHQIRDDVDYARHMDYLHYNPVKHGLVKQAGDWPYSSFNRYVNSGVYGENWAMPLLSDDGGFGDV